VSVVSGKINDANAPCQTPVFCFECFGLLGYDSQDIEEGCDIRSPARLQLIAALLLGRKEETHF